MERKLNMDVAELSIKLIDWIKEKVNAANAKGTVFGLSGGIDSAVVAVLCKKAFPDGVLGIIMPCHSSQEDEKYARLVSDKFEIPVEKIVLDDPFDSLVKTLGDIPYSRNMAVVNIKPRLRMTTLNYFASKNKYLVAGTSNLSELTIGYFTKHGDSGVDILPIANLVKTKVKELAVHLGVPEDVVKRVPTAGLWEGQTDEGEMGMSYEQLDNYILTKQAPKEIRQRVDSMNERSEHKRNMPLRPVF
jgi:NAD+ synthase